MAWLRVATAAVACWLGAGTCSSSESPAGTPYTLLYSTVGYEAGGTKRALVRGLGIAGGPGLDLERSRWHLVGGSGDVLAEGPLRPLGTTFGAPLWEIDFSQSSDTGAGLRLAVRLESAGGRADDARSAPLEIGSLPFPIRKSLFSSGMALSLSLRNAELRRAPEPMGGGYYDCNSRMGEAYSHAMFAAGLIELERRRADQLDPVERARLRDEIHHAIDYVLSLHVDVSGEIANQHRSRPGGNPGAFNTQEGVYGLVQYLALGRAGDPARSAEIERRVRLSLGFLERQEELYPELGAAVWARLYARSGSPADLEEGVRHVEALVSTFAPRTRFRHPLRGVPWFEGMVLLAPAVDPGRRSRWTDRARAWSQALLEAAAGNGYGVVPPLGEAEWDDMAAVPVSRVEHSFFANAHFLATTVDALLLAELTGEPSLERLAAAGLQWVTGLNPGFRAAVVTGPPAAPDEPPYVAASFIVNGPGRHVLPWRRWWWEGFKGAPRAQTVVNGFVALPQRGLVYDTDEWQPAETFIRTDGLLLRAALHYEDHLRAGGR